MQGCQNYKKKYLRHSVQFTVLYTRAGHSRVKPPYEHVNDGSEPRKLCVIHWRKYNKQCSLKIILMVALIWVLQERQADTVVKTFVSLIPNKKLFLGSYKFFWHFWKFCYEEKDYKKPRGSLVWILMEAKRMVLVGLSPFCYNIQLHQLFFCKTKYGPLESAMSHAWRPSVWFPVNRS